MGTFLGIFLATLATAWMGVNIVRGLWSDAGEAVEGTTFIGIVTGMGSALTMNKMKKSTHGWRPKILNFRNTVNSLRRRR